MVDQPAKVAAMVHSLTEAMMPFDPTTNEVVSTCFTLASRSMAVVLEREPYPHNREMFRATLERMLLQCTDDTVKH